MEATNKVMACHKLLARLPSNLFTEFSRCPSLVRPNIGHVRQDVCAVHRTDERREQMGLECDRSVRKLGG